MTVLPMIDQQIRDQQFQGFGVPIPCVSWWREVLEIPPYKTITREDIESQFKKLAQIKHPDHGGSEQEFRKLVEARKAARLEVA